MLTKKAPEGWRTPGRSRESLSESILRSLFVARPQSAAVTALFMRATFHASQSGVAAALCHRSTKFPHCAWWPITKRGLPARCPSSLKRRRDRFAAR